MASPAINSQQSSTSGVTKASTQGATGQEKEIDSQDATGLGDQTKIPLVRTSSRERTLTEKGREMHEKQQKKDEKAFTTAYTKWIHTARGGRTALKTFCTGEDLHTIKQTIQTKHQALSECYEIIQHNHTATPVIVKRMDACISITQEICELVNKYLETIHKPFNEQMAKAHVRIVLNKEEYGSIFGETNTETVISDASHGTPGRVHSRGTQPLQSKSPSIAISDGSSIQSHHSNATSRASRKRADAEADLAAKQEKARALQEIQGQQAKLQAEKVKLQQLKAQKDIRVAAARLKAYDNFNTDDNTPCSNQTNDNPLSVLPNVIPSSKQNIISTTPQSTETSSQPSAALNLTQSLISSLSLNRLPAPEPTTFSGEPLDFVDWKMSFAALIDRQPLSPSEKLFYLKHYLAGEALRAVEGFFYRNSNDAYEGAWKVLQERYGSPFVIQRAFRDKLTQWPKVGPNDPFALRGLADFLQSCVEAMPHVKGLSILNDCEENHKILKKLPDWLVRGWSRVVARELDESGDYPSLSCFANYLQTEARIVCNPMASPFLVNHRHTDEKIPRRITSFHTSAQSNGSQSRSLLTCPICNQEAHGIAT